MGKNGILRKIKPYNHGHSSALKKTIDNKDMSISKLANNLKTMSHQSLFTHQHSPEKYTVEQIREIASLIGISTEALMVELGLIEVPVSYDLVKDVYVYA